MSLAELRGSYTSAEGIDYKATEANLKRTLRKIEANRIRLHHQKLTTTVPASLIQTIDSSTPEDGFAKVEAKLKALQEKIKADTAKFEAEAKAPASSFLETSPDDGFAKVEAKLKALQEKIKADT